MTNDPRQLSRVTSLSIASGATGTLWLIVCAPQAIFNVFMRNHLGATSAQLGLLVGMLSLASVLQLPSILIYRKLRRRKLFWIITSVIHRFNGPVLAAVAFSVARGGSREQGIVIITVAMVLSWIITNLSSSGWWSWMADLVPNEVRARFFGRRSAVAQGVNVVAFFTTTVVLDAAVGDRLFLIYGTVFLIGGIGGIVDILLHVLMPEPVRASEEPEQPFGSGFFNPVRDRNFLRFALTTGLVLFSINVSAPFIAPYVTSPEGVGAPNTWLGIMFVISQMTWIAVSAGWGTIMDQFGRKPVVMIGLLFTISWVGYLVVTPANYFVILPIVALVGGVLAPAFWDGINQLMLSLTKEEDRLTYIAWYWTIIGTVSAGGSLMGGLLDDFFATRSVSLGPVTVGGFHAVLLTSLLLVAVSLLVLSRVEEGPAKPVGFVFTRVATPGIFRTFLNIGVLARTDSSERVARTLRSIDSASDDLAVRQVMERIHDPDPDVRDEAVRALGRLRSHDAIDALIELLVDPASTLRVEAARALGHIRSERALPHLIDATSGSSEELRRACATAIGEIGGTRSVTFLSELLRADTSDNVAATGASALSLHGAFEAAWEIVPRLHRTRNPMLRSQLAIALANLFGRPGEFYRYITGSEEQQYNRSRKLAQEAMRRARGVLGRALSPELLRQVESGDVLAALESLRATADAALAERFLPGSGRTVEDRHALMQTVYAANARLGLWYWFLNETLAPVAADIERPNRQLELLIALYYLRVA